MISTGLDKELNLETSMRLDLENVGKVTSELSEPRASWNSATKRTPSKLSQFGVHFVENVSKSSFSYIFEVGTLIRSLMITLKQIHSNST